MSKNSEAYIHLFDSLKDQNISDDNLHEELLKKGYLLDEVQDIVKLYKKYKSDRRLQNGFTMIGIGAFLGLVSCIFTILGILPEMRDFILYGLTTIGITIAFGGCYYIFE